MKNKTALKDYLLVGIFFLLLVAASEGAFLIRGELTKRQRVFTETKDELIKQEEGDAEIRYFGWQYVGWLNSIGLNLNLLSHVNTEISFSGFVSEINHLNPQKNSDYLIAQVKIAAANGQKVTVGISGNPSITSVKVISYGNKNKSIAGLDQLKTGDFVTLTIKVRMEGNFPFSDYIFEVK